MPTIGRHLEAMIPTHRKGQYCHKTIAHRCLDDITKRTKVQHCKAWSYHFVARVEALALPVILVLSIVQKGFTTLRASLNVIICMPKADESICQELRDLIYLVGALAYMILPLGLPYLYGILSPEAFRRDDTPKSTCPAVITRKHLIRSEGKVKEKTTRLKEKEGEAKRLSKELKNATDNLQQSERQCETHQEEVRELKDTITQKEREAKRLSEELKNATHSLQQSERQCETHQEEVRELKDTITQKEREAKRLSEELEKATDNLQRSETQCEAHQEEVRELKDTITQKEGEAKRLSEELEKATDNLQRSETQCEAHQEEVRELKDTITQKEREAKRLSEELKNATDNLQQTETQCETHQEEVRELKDTITQKEREAKRLSEELEKATDNLQRSETQCEAHQEEGRELKDTITQKEGEAKRLSEELEKATDNLQRSETQCEAHQKEVRELKDTITQKEGEAKKLSEELEAQTQATNKEIELLQTNMLNWAYAHIPILTKESVDNFNTYCEKKRIKGVSAESYFYTGSSKNSPKENSEDESKVAPDTGTWRMEMNLRYSEERLKEKSPNNYQSPFQNLITELSNSKEPPQQSLHPNFLIPEGTIELRIDGNLVKDPYFSQLLNNEHHCVDRLVLTDIDLTTITQKEKSEPHVAEKKKNGLLSKIHTLVLKKESVTVEELLNIAGKFPNIACFDLQSVKIIKGDLSLLEEPYERKKSSKSENNKRTRFDEGGGGPSSNSDEKAEKAEDTYTDRGHIVIRNDGTSNEAEKFYEMETMIFSYVKEYAQLPETERVQNEHIFVEKFGGYSHGELFHPAAPFVNRVLFVAGLPLTETFLDKLLDHLKNCFRNMTTLNLSKCSRLTTNNLDLISHFKLSDLYINDCEMLSYKRETSIKPSDIFNKQKIKLKNPDVFSFTQIAYSEFHNNQYEIEPRKEGKNISYCYKTTGFGPMGARHLVGLIHHKFSSVDHYYRLAKPEETPNLRLFLEDNNQKFYFLNETLCTIKLDYIFSRGCDRIYMSYSALSSERTKDLYPTIDAIGCRGAFIIHSTPEDGGFTRYPKKIKTPFQV